MGVPTKQEASQPWQAPWKGEREAPCDPDFPPPPPRLAASSLASQASASSFVKRATSSLVPEGGDKDQMSGKLGMKGAGGAFYWVPAGFQACAPLTE